MVETRANRTGLPLRGARRTQSAMPNPPPRIVEEVNEQVDESRQEADPNMANGNGNQARPGVGSEATSPPLAGNSQVQGRRERPGVTVRSDRTYGSSRQSRGSFTSSQYRAVQDMVYSAVHNAMAGLMPPPPSRPPQATANAENVQPAENVQQAGVARPIVQPVPVAVAPMRNVGDGNSYE